MTDIAMRCEECLNKRYRIGQRESYKALRGVPTNCIAARFRRLGKFRNLNSYMGGEANW